MADVVPIKSHKGFHRGVKRSVQGCLKTARALELVEVLVIGTDKNGDTVVRSPVADPGNALWLMEMAKKKLLGD